MDGLMIKGMTVAGLHLANTVFINSAQHAVDFLLRNVWQKKRLLACYRDNNALSNVYLDDYAFLGNGLLTLLQARWRTNDFQWLIELVQALLSHFWDDHAGGFFFTAKYHENLIQRPKTFMDEALPAGNAIALRILITLGYLLAETRYLQAVEQTLSMALRFFAYSSTSTSYRAMISVLQKLFRPTYHHYFTRPYR